MGPSLIDDDVIWEAHQQLEDKGFNTKWNTFKPNFVKSFQVLRNLAKQFDTITYKNLGQRTSTDHRRYLSIWLRGINYHEEQLGRPPLSALVVTVNERIPANGFFEQMDDLGYYDPNHDDRVKVTDKLQMEVYDYW